MSNRRLLPLFVSLVSLAALSIYVSKVRDADAAYERDTTSYMRLNIGASRDETLYIFGYPQHVIGSGQSDQWAPIYQVDGKDPINAMPTGKTIDDFDEWSIDRDGYRIDIAFDPITREVTKIGCYVNRAQTSANCPSIFGVDAQIDEDQVRDQLGEADRIALKGVTKTLHYDELGLDITLTKRDVYMITKRKGKGSTWWRRVWHVWL